MLRNLLMMVVILASGISVLGQNKTYESPDKSLRVVLIPVRMKGYAADESRVEIRTLGGRVLRWRSFASRDHNHGEEIL
jgi:hypothetical protein